MQCIGYKRTSQDHNPSKSQEAAIRHRASELGYAEGNIVWIEDVAPGDSSSRPGLLEMQRLLQQGRIGHVICFDLDRLARESHLAREIATFIDKAGAKLEIVSNL